MKKILLIIFVGILFPVLALAFTYFEGNPYCCDLGYCESDFMIDGPVSSGNYSDGVLSVNLVVIEEKCFDWSSNIPVNAVIVKGGVGVNLYEYSPASTGDFGMCAPDPLIISHILFCYSVEEPPPTAKYIPLPDDLNTSILATIGELFTDLSPVVASIGIGLPLAFWGVKKVISLSRFR